MEKHTRYGKLVKRDSKYVIVAPHGVQCDDKNTARLTELVSQYLNASAVINTEFARDESGTTNFNNIKKPHPVKNKFYKDIGELVSEAEKTHDTCIVVYLHGMKDDRYDSVGIDIGCGVKELDGELLSVIEHPGDYASRGNSGKVRANREQIKTLKNALNEKLNNENLRATIGRYFPAWSSANGVQYHQGKSKTASMQLEISATLRQKQNLESTAKMIAEALKKTYN